LIIPQTPRFSLVFCGSGPAYSPAQAGNTRYEEVHVMPFDIGKAAAHVRRVVIEFNDEKLTLRYGAGAPFKHYEHASRALQQEYFDLQRKLERGDVTPDVDEGATDEERRKASDEAYTALVEKVKGARRELADNICTVIEWWDLEGDRDAIRSLMSPKDQREYKDVTGHGEVPINGAWLDALPLPDEFIEKVVEKIREDFDKRGAGGKVRS